MRIRTHSVPLATVLFIDIKGFTTACAEMGAGHVGEWVAEFYHRVDVAASAYGVSKVEVRGDCCICVSGVGGAVPCRALAAADNDAGHDQATRMLAFAAALHADLRTLTAGAGRAEATATRMGLAAGEVAFLVGERPDGGADGFVSVHGDAVNLAARMEGLADPGAAQVHRSAAERWAAEARRPVPHAVAVEVKGRGLQRAAVFDLAAAAFRGPAPPPPPLPTPPRRLPWDAGPHRGAFLRRASLP
jgi:class 3 adenylate cyclase